MYFLTRTTTLHSVLFSLLLLATSSHSLNITVQVTLAPGPSTQFPQCSTTLLELFQFLLTHWITEATSPLVPGFTMSDRLELANYNNRRRRDRMLRGDNQEDETTFVERFTKASPQPCSTCTSAGCAQYCGNAGCDFCGSSRRLTTFEEYVRMPAHRRLQQGNSSSQGDDDEQGEDNGEQDKVNEGQQPYSDSSNNSTAIDFTDVGTQVTAAVQDHVQSILLSHVLDLVGCFGDPLFLAVNVTFTAI